MDIEFVYERLRTPLGVKVEIITGSHARSGRVWRLMAEQIYAENGRDEYRAIDHLDCGAPLLMGEDTRISLTHTGHLLAVATLAPTPEADLSRFSAEAALGIDAESLDRDQVLRVRERFLSADELALVAADSLEANIIAWTIKEAVYKAMLTPGLDYRHAIRILRLPRVDSDPAKSHPADDAYGKAVVTIGEEEIEYLLYTFSYEGYAVTLAVTPRSRRWGK